MVAALGAANNTDWSPSSKRHTILCMSTTLSHPPAPIPNGVADHFWAQARERRALETRLLALFRSWGYDDVLLPAFEYAETIDDRANRELRDDIYRFVDRDGRMLALRADMTIPVARLVATRLHDVPMPQRFCYAGSVFRYGETRAGQQREFMQAGVELIGGAEAAADAEVLALTVHAVRSAGIGNVRLAVGHVGYFHSLLHELSLPEPAAAALFEAVDRNSDAALAAFLQQTDLPAQHRNVIAEFPRLSGDSAHDILMHAERIALNDGMVAAVENLRAVLNALCLYGLSESVYLDLTEVHNLGYYTGISFEALAPGLGFALAGGGRYDHLVGTFGAPQPAVGAALTLDRLLLAAGTTSGTPTPIAPDLLVQAHGNEQAFAVVHHLRLGGWQAVIELTTASGDRLADIARQRGAAAAIEWQPDGFAWICATHAPDSTRMAELRAALQKFGPVQSETDRGNS